VRPSALRLRVPSSAFYISLQKLVAHLQCWLNLKSGRKAMATAAEKALQRVKEIEGLLKQARVRAQKIEATAKAKESKTTRAQRERKKYLVGALVLETMEKDGSINQRMIEKLDRFLTRPSERALFDLNAIRDSSTNPVVPAQAANAY
jgi:Fe2+ transport system protein B